MNLPVSTLQVRCGPYGVIQVHDRVRRSWVALTPEEFVRQRFLAFLTDVLGYSPYRLAVETGLKVNGRSRRADTVVLDNSLRPLMVLEFKAPDVVLDQGVLDQVLRYNLTFGAPFVGVSNGVRHVAFDAGAQPCVIARSLGDWPGYDFLAGL